MLVVVTAIIISDSSVTLVLQKMSDDVNDVEKEKRIIIIQTLLAFELFCQKRFEESLRNFANLNTG